MTLKGPVQPRPNFTFAFGGYHLWMGVFFTNSKWTHCTLNTELFSIMCGMGPSVFMVGWVGGGGLLVLGHSQSQHKSSV